MCRKPRISYPFSFSSLQEKRLSPAKKETTKDAMLCLSLVGTVMVLSLHRCGLDAAICVISAMLQEMPVFQAFSVPPVDCLFFCNHKKSSCATLPFF